MVGTLVAIKYVQKYLDSQKRETVKAVGSEVEIVTVEEVAIESNQEVEEEKKDEE